MVDQPQHEPERRTAPRAPLALDVTLRREGSDPSRHLARDLSTAGVFLLSAAPLEVGTGVSVSVALPGADPIEVRGEVVRSVVVRDFSMPPLSGMGIRFVELGDSDAERIARLVDSVRSALDAGH